MKLSAGKTKRGKKSEREDKSGRTPKPAADGGDNYQPLAQNVGGA